MYSEGGHRANGRRRETDGGHIVATYTSSMPEWFADDSLWEAIYPFEFPEAAIAAGETQVANALRLRGVPQSGTALVRTFDFSLRVYSGRELRDLLGRAGFSSVDLYGGLDGRRYGLEAERLVAVASKRGADAD